MNTLPERPSAREAFFSQPSELAEWERLKGLECPLGNDATGER